MTKQTIQEAANEHYASRFDDEQRALIEGVNNDDEALERLQEQPLSFQKLQTNHVEETVVWEILLGTGGPADRILVTTDDRGMVESADYQYQDWFEPWTSAKNQDAELVQRYAEIVGFYE